MRESAPLSSSLALSPQQIKKSYLIDAFDNQGDLQTVMYPELFKGCANVQLDGALGNA